MIYEEICSDRFCSGLIRLKHTEKMSQVDYFHRDTENHLSEDQREMKQLDAHQQQDVVINQTTDVQQLVLIKEEASLDWSSDLDQRNPECLEIKEEENEHWTNGEEEDEDRWENIRNISFPLNVIVKTEDSEEEENCQYLQPSQSFNDGSSEAEPPTSSSVQPVKTESDEEDCGGPEPDRNPAPNTHVQLNTDEKASESSETEASQDEDEVKDHSKDNRETVTSSGSESEDSDEDWRKTRTLRSRVKGKTRCKTSKKPFRCPECFKRFVNKLSFQRHVTSHSGKSSSSVGGEKRCRRKRNVDSKTGENARKTFTCDDCGKNFISQYYLKCHMSVHTGEKPFSCDFCGRTFKCLQILKCHIRLHTGEKPFACDKCSKTFSHLPSLKLHMTHHTGERPFRCNVCNKKFSLQGTLKLHMTIHTGEKPFACTSCNRCFRLRGDLKAHMMSHSGEKPFSCSDCGAKFARHGSLLRHARVHTGERPFPCDKCDKRFFQNSHLKKHSSVHADQKVYTV
uniref:C2H2-type domain-containing protein n=1 Tax=Iconisemion striatum TaxID=60296 RepID=A0A1A7YW84_9TELE